MWFMVVFRYPGAKWRTFSAVVERASLSEAMRQATAAHPTASVQYITGYSVEGLLAQKQLYIDEGVLEEGEGEGPQGVPPSEDGEGGDVNPPYTGPVLPDSWGTVSKWARLMGKFRRGEVGGANDGAIPLGPAKEASEPSQEGSQRRDSSQNESLGGAA